MCHKKTIVEGTGSLLLMAKHLLSKATYARLEAEIAHLEHDVLPEVADKIGRAREMGDLKENGDYHAAKDEYGMFNDRKNLLLSILEDSELATPPAAGEVGVLSTVTILFAGDDEDDAETYLIGHIEEKRTELGIEVMSPVSPIGSALLGHKQGDGVNITLENGAKISVTILKVAN
jgi:transcription elongation factor GreA